MKKLRNKTSADDTVSDVDKDRLDEEWHRHPKLVETYAIRAADAYNVYMRAKSELDLVEADQSLYIRQHFEVISGGKIKMTEKVIDSFILQNPKYIEALAKVQAAKYKLDLLDAVMRALEHRKKALENLVILEGRNYFSSPRITGDSELSEVIENLDKKKTRSKGRKEVL